MFCSHCGIKLNEGVAFCSGCGGKVGEPMPSPQSSMPTKVVPASDMSAGSISTKRRNKIILIAAAVLAVVIVLILVRGSSGELDGVWEVQGGGYPDWIQSSVRSGTVRFRGSSFSLTTYFAFDSRNSGDGTTINIGNISRPGLDVHSSVWWGTSSSSTQTRLASPHDGISMRVFRITTEGTFSITGDRIELVLSDGTINTFPFARTENTIDINRQRFVRR